MSRCLIIFTDALRIGYLVQGSEDEDIARNIATRIPARISKLKRVAVELN